MIKIKSQYTSDIISIQVKKEYNMMKTVVEGGSLCGTID